jgi:hydroxyacylglutathione hydrolase
MNITKNLHLLKIDFLVQITTEKSLPRFVNSLIIFGESITVIDCGVKESYKLIYNYIEKNGRDPGEIKTLILSHSHPDHIGSANRIKTDTGCKVIGPLPEKNWIENIDLQFKSRPVPGFYGLVDESVKLDEILTGGENLELDKNIHISVVNTPGHSKGSFSILFKEDLVLFTADSLPLANDIPTYDNFKELKKSIELIKSISDYEILLSSWTSPMSDKSEIAKLFGDAESYLNRLDIAVKQYYPQNEVKTLENCGKVISSLNLPPFYVVPLVDRAFRTH